MNVDAILVSDFADITPDGKLTVVGAFNSIGAPEFPARHPILSISVLVHAHPSEGGKEATLKIVPINARRENFLPDIEITLQLPDVTPPDGMPLRYLVSRRLIGVVFPEPGPYAFEVYIDGTYHAAATIFVGTS